MRLLKGIFLLAILVNWELSSASFIEMATEISIVDATDGLELVVTSENRGDEPSYGVRLDVEAGAGHFTTSPVTRLSVSERVLFRFPIDGAFDLPGRYPIVIKTHYKDANAYSFSALTVGFYDHLQPVLSKVQLRVEDTRLPANGSARLPVRIRNGDSEPRDLELELHLPNELASRSTVQNLKLESGSEAVISYVIENFSALENSAYAVAVVAEYDVGEYHYSESGPAVVRITEARLIPEAGIWGLAVAGLTVFVLAIAILRKRGTKA